VWSQAEQERVRRLAVAAVVEQGMSVAAAGRVFGVSRQTVSGWVNGFRRQGEPALTAGQRGRRAGEQQALALWMQGQLVQTIRGHNPDQLRLPFFLWTREAVRELIRSRYGIELALTTVGQYLKRWGFTPQKPVQRAFEQNPVAVARWLEREYPAIEARAKTGRRPDPLGRRDGPALRPAAGRSYAPRGRTPVVGRSPSRRTAASRRWRRPVRVSGSVPQRTAAHPGRCSLTLPGPDMEHLTAPSPGRDDRVIPELMGVPVASFLLAVPIHLADKRIDVNNEALGAGAGTRRPRPL
jgi:transposase